MQVTINWPEGKEIGLPMPDGTIIPLDAFVNDSLYETLEFGFRQRYGDASAGTRKEMESKGEPEEAIVAAILAERMTKATKIVNDELSTRGPTGPRGSKRDTVFQRVALEELKKLAVKSNFALPKAKSPEFEQLFSLFCDQNKEKLDEEVTRQMSADTTVGLVLPGVQPAA